MPTYRHNVTGELVEAKLRHEWVFIFADRPDFFYSYCPKKGEGGIRDMAADKFEAQYTKVED